ncbi:MAG: Chemotaxis response regulator protein-glutamate methylesterase [Fimbriimonadaceae bacterium]|nr:Chemotaxis response regulator protein-glutamate methylesterase [Fimbriimonadaceae bacterium]
MSSGEPTTVSADGQPITHDPDDQSMVERKPALPFYVAGIGASAGGLEAMTELFGNLPNVTGMAFVVVSHLSPKHPSLLSEILGRATNMTVVEVQDEPEVQPNTVYVIPPGRVMVMDQGKLWLTDRLGAQANHRPIDKFLRSLAEEQRNHSIGVILSGSASDGTLGCEEIKAMGGLVFAHEDRSPSRSEGGLGIGLTLVKKLTEMHGGRVTVESDGAEKGSTFSIDLPAVQYAQNAVPQTAAEVTMVIPRKIVIIDDNLDAANVMSRLLEVSGHHVTTIHDSASVQEAIRTSGADIAILDIGLPEIDGFVLAKMIRKEFGDKIRLIALTGYGDDADRRRGTEAGFDYYFTKPVDFIELRRALLP